MSEHLEWKEPPPGYSPRIHNGSIKRQVELLKKRPGKWAVIRRTPYPGGGIVKVLRNYGAEAMCVREEKGGYATFARWPKSKRKGR